MFTEYRTTRFPISITTTHTSPRIVAAYTKAQGVYCITVNKFLGRKSGAGFAFDVAESVASDVLIRALTSELLHYEMAEAASLIPSYRMEEQAL